MSNKNSAEGRAFHISPVVLADVLVHMLLLTRCLEQQDYNGVALPGR